MIAFEVFVNDKKACVAGVDGCGVLTAILSWADRVPKTDPETGTAYPSQELTLEVGGLRSVERTHLSWLNHSLDVGDVVTVKITNLAAVDEPSTSVPIESADIMREAKRRQYEELKKEFGA
jgi:hypothetical protein